MSEEEALWQAIDAMPEDALRRLVLADWLEENAGVVACGCLNAAMHAGRVSLSFEGVPVADMGLVATFSCDLCNGTGFTLDGRADLARALRATAGKVPWVRAFKLGFGWWCRLPFHHTHRLNDEHLIERQLMDAMGDSQERCDPDDIVSIHLYRFDKGGGVSGGVILFPTASAAIKALCRAYIAVHCKSGVPA